VNVCGAENVCQAARMRNVDKIIFTSTVAVYGFAPLGTNESGEIKPFNDYGRTKWQSESIYKAWQGEKWTVPVIGKFALQLLKKA